MPCHGDGDGVLAASGRRSEKKLLSIPTLQSRMKCDPGGYESELLLVHSQFSSSLELFHQQADMNFTSITGVASDPTVAKHLGDRAKFLAHVIPFYPNHLALADFPKKLADLLRRKARLLPSGLRFDVAIALGLLVKHRIVDIGGTLSLFMELQTLGDKNLTKLAFRHVVQNIKDMNQKHKNEVKNRALQRDMFKMLQKEDEALAKRVLVTLCELYQRKVWFDDRTANAICTACFHPASRIMNAALSFLLDYEKVENNEDSDDSDSDDESTESPHVILNRRMIYKANHQGTTASKRKNRRKLQRSMRSMKRHERLSSERSNNSYYSPLNYLLDKQGFAERLFSRLQTSNEGFKVRMKMMKLIARVVGLHQLTLLNFYPCIQNYIQPHQHDVVNLLAAVVQACHDKVPPDAVEPLFKHIVNQFLHDRSCPEATAVGLNAVREICIRMPLLMNEDLLQDLVEYRKFRDMAVSTAARSLVNLFKEVCPSLLVKKDRGRPINPKARPKAYGEVDVATDVPGVELLQNIDNDGEQESGDSDDSACIDIDNDQENDQMRINNGDDENQLFGENAGSDDNYVGFEDEEERSSDCETGISDADDNVDDKGDNLVVSEPADIKYDEVSEHGVDDLHSFSNDEILGTKSKTNDSTKKRKFSDFNGKLMAANRSLRALTKLARTTMGHSLPESTDGILSNEDFQRIKELEKATKPAIKVPTSDQLSLKRVDASMLEVHVRKKLNKDERLALVKAGREERGKYQARTAVKQKKTGGLSNLQKEHKKKMPLAAKTHKVRRSGIEKKRKNARGKQFRGRKAWK